MFDLGRAAVIAEVPRECGYPDCTAEAVTFELARPGVGAASSAASPPERCRSPAAAARLAP